MIFKFSKWTRGFFKEFREGCLQYLQALIFCSHSENMKPFSRCENVRFTMKISAGKEGIGSQATVEAPQSYKTTRHV